MLVLFKPDVNKRVQIVYEVTFTTVITPRSDSEKYLSYMNKAPQS